MPKQPYKTKQIYNRIENPISLNLDKNKKSSLEYEQRNRKKSEFWYTKIEIFTICIYFAQLRIKF